MFTARKQEVKMMLMMMTTMKAKRLMLKPHFELMYLLSPVLHLFSLVAEAVLLCIPTALLMHDTDIAVLSVCPLMCTPCSAIV